MAESTHMNIVLRNVFWFPRMLGTFPFDHNFEVNMKISIRSICVLIFFSICSAINLFDSHDRRIIKIAFTSFANLISFVVLIVRRNDALSMYKSLQKVEMDMQNERMNHKWLPSHFRMYLSYYIFIVMLFITACVRFDPSNISNIFTMILSYASTFALSLSIINQFSMLQALLGSLFDQLLESKNINSILAILTNLRSASTAMESMYGIQILFYTTAIFIFIVCNVYYELRCEYPTAIKVVHRVWVILISYPLVDMIVSSSNTVTKARKLNEKLYEKMLEDIMNFPNQNEQLEFHLTCGKELKFDACGFFRLDNSLICSMIACGTTYMVILMQYTNSLLACRGPSQQLSSPAAA
ncbi:Gustatory receptor 96 [Halyomorpha halys]|nr:Gustatory receptor 96 [Halyomorpha halys]